MTQKELNYVEDAIKHENNIISICEETIDCLEDENLANFMKDELKKHESMLKKLINKMEGLSNE